jgi:hypothetical protein
MSRFKSLEQELIDLDKAQQTKEGMEEYVRKYDGPFRTLVEDSVIREIHDGYKALFCPSCAEHEQKSKDDATHFAHGGCKNEIVEVRQDPKDGLWKPFTRTQCACNGPDHGILKGWY